MAGRSRVSLGGRQRLGQITDQGQFRSRQNHGQFRLQAMAWSNNRLGSVQEQAGA